MNRKRMLKTMVAGAVGVGTAGLLAGVGALVAGRAMWHSFSSVSLSGNVVLITGASRGLGLALAEECVENGCRLAICGRDEESLRRAERELRAMGAEVLALRCDVGKRPEVERMVRDVIAHYGKIDLLINNAGTIAVGPLNAQTIEDFQEAMDVMFWGAVHTTLLVLPHLLPYSAAKFAITGLSEGITTELADKGIKVTTVIPGLMRTGSHVNAFFKGDHRAEYAWFGVSASTPLLAMSAQRAAQRIVRAIRQGQTEVTLGLPAKIAALAHGLAPATTVRALGLANRALPVSADDSKARHRGNQCEGAATKSPLTVFG